MNDAKIDRSREGTVLAPALYAPESVRILPDGSVEVIGKPLRAEVRLISAYTPAWWYASCRCLGLYAASKDEFDPYLTEQALVHRCATPSAP